MREFLFFTSIVLGGGDLLRLMCLPAVAYWCTVAIIMVRRDAGATAIDRLFLRWGFLLWILGLVAAAAVINTILPTPT